MKIHTTGPDHMTKMAAMAIYGKSINKPAYLTLKDLWS